MKKKEKIKLAMIQQSPDLGGAESFMVLLLKNLRSKNFEVFTAADDNKFFKLLKKEKFNPVKIPYTLDIIGNVKGLVKSIFFLPLTTIFYINLLSSYKKNNVDVILMSGFSEKMLVTAISALFKIPVVWIEYSSLGVVFKRSFMVPKLCYHFLSPIAKKVIVPTDNTKNHLVREAPEIKNKIEVIPCGVVFTRRKKRSIKDKFIVGNISRLTREKGQDFVIDAIPEVIKKNDKIHFIFVGGGPDLDYFRTKVERLGVKENVTFTGFVKDIQEHLDYMDAFIFPSNWNLEGFGLVTVEAMSRNIPVIGNNFGPTREILSGGAGVLVDVKNKKIFADTILKISSNKAYRSGIAEKGYEKAKREYDISKVSESYAKLLREIASEQ